MLHIFGLDIPTAATPVDRTVANALAGRMAATTASLKHGAPAAVAADVRHDARRYLAARREGRLRFPGAAGRACDQGAQGLMRLTVDAPARVARAPERLVA